MTVSEAIQKMTYFYDGSTHDINHFLKVWAYAKTIGEAERLDEVTQKTLELASVVHDIACPLCREKYGKSYGAKQEAEGEILAREFFKDTDTPDDIVDRICFLVAHHHTFNGIDGIDYQILLEADFLVNADESKLNKKVITAFKNRVFKTGTGTKLLNSVYGV